MFDAVHGVLSTTVGYTGGANSRPTYESVCGGDGHTEALLVEFDSTKVSYGRLVDRFFAAHWFSGENETQYMSAIFVQNDAQRDAAEKKIQSLQRQGEYVATKILPATRWHDAEEYHQDYLKKQHGRYYY